MDIRRFEQGSIYSGLMVTAIKQDRTFSHGVPPTKKYVHHITFLHDNGFVLIGEYVIESPEQHVFEVGKKSPEFKCTLNGNKGDEIWPTGFHSPTRPRHEHAAASRQGAQPKSAVVSSMAGQSQVFAMGFAKDLMVAQVQAGAYIDSDFTDDLLKLADNINDWLAQKQRDQSFNNM